MHISSGLSGSLLTDCDLFLMPVFHWTYTTLTEFLAVLLRLNHSDYFTYSGRQGEGSLLAKP